MTVCMVDLEKSGSSTRIDLKDVMGMLSSSDKEFGDLVAQIVATYLAHHTLAAEDVPDLIRSVRRTMETLCVAPSEAKSALPVPAVPITKSVFADYIICLEDGRKMQTLKRHLKVVYGMEPADYRAKWGLPDSYPMVSPNYGKRRAELAKANGLGHRRRPAATEPVIQKIPEGRSGLRQARRKETETAVVETVTQAE